MLGVGVFVFICILWGRKHFFAGPLRSNKQGMHQRINIHTQEIETYLQDASLMMFSLISIDF